MARTFFLPQRGRQQQLPQVVGKDPDGRLVGAFLGLEPGLRLHGPAQQSLVAVVDGFPHLLRGRALPLDELRFEEPEGILFRRRDEQGEDLLVFAAPHGEHPVRGRRGDGLLPLEVVAELRPLGLLVGDDLRFEHALCGEEIAHLRPGLLVFVDPLGDDVPGAGQGILGGLDAFFGIDETGGRGGGVRVFLLGKEKDGQGLEALFLCDGGPGAALGPEGQIDVLEDGHRLGGVNLRLQFFRQELALAQGLEDGLAALVELGELLQAVPDRGDGHLVEGARGLFSIAGDEGHRAPLVEKAGNGLHLAGSQAQFNCDLCDMGILHGYLETKDDGSNIGMLRPKTGALFLINWRKCMGIEPTWEGISPPHWI